MKPLKILLGNNTLSLLAGSETWTLTLAIALKEMGHDVSCFSPNLGYISSLLKEKGIPSYSDVSTSDLKTFSFVLQEKIHHEYDVIIANHNHIVDYLRSQFPKTPIISTIHGIIHKEEDGTIAPEHPALDAGVSQFVSVSEEVQKKLKDEYKIDSIIIRNFFDVKKFENMRPVSLDKPEQFLINTNYSEKNDPQIEVIREAAKHFGARVSAVGYNFVHSTDIRKAIEDADVVFGMGRSVLEGIAGGRLGIVHGRWGTGGVICESMINELGYFNFSGRNNNGKMASKEQLIEMIERYYNPQTLDWGRQYILENHNVVWEAEKYVQLARELTGQMFVRPQNLGPVDPQARKFRLEKDVA